MKIAPKIKEALEDGELRIVSQIWQLINGAEVVHKKSNGVIYNIGEMSQRLRRIAGDEFISLDQVERAVKGMARRGKIRAYEWHPEIKAGDKTYQLRFPVTHYGKA